MSQRLFCEMSTLNNRGPMYPKVPTSYQFLPMFNNSTNVQAMASHRTKPLYPYQIAKYTPPPMDQPGNKRQDMSSSIASGPAFYDRLSIRQFDPCPDNS